MKSLLPNAAKHFPLFKLTSLMRTLCDHGHNHVVGHSSQSHRQQPPGDFSFLAAFKLIFSYSGKLLLMFWKSAGSYDVVPVLTGICLNTYIHTYVYCLGEHDYLHLWYGFTPKFPRSFETEKKYKSQVYSCSKEGPKCKDFEVWFGQTPRSWDEGLASINLGWIN